MSRPRPPDRLDRILDAAERVFGERGLERTRMSDVAAAASVSQGTLYNYVASKEALFGLLLDRAMGAPAPSQDALPVASPPLEALAGRMDEVVSATFALPRLDAALKSRRASHAAAELAEVIDELFERTLTTRSGADVLERSSFEVPQLAAVFYGKVRTRILERLSALIRKRVRAGHYRAVDPLIAARIVVETVTMFARHIYRDPHPLGFDLADARREVIAMLVAGLIAPS